MSANHVLKRIAEINLRKKNVLILLKKINSGKFFEKKKAMRKVGNLKSP